MNIRVSYSFDLDVWNYLRSVYKFVWHKHGRDGLQNKLLLALPDRVGGDLKKARDEKSKESN